jgi:serine/threonine protein kinase
LAQAQPFELSPLRVVGRYALFGEIASGGMATVYLGRLRGPANFAPTVAIKAMHPAFSRDAQFVRMLREEARLAALIRHPNVVPVLDVVAEQANLFLVLEYVHGDSFAKLWGAARSAREPIPPGIAAAVVCDALHGLHAAHEARDERGKPLEVVHRDVSPHNILVGADGIARLLDFGIAKAAGCANTTRAGQMKGKLPYMAPEQLRGGRVSRQTDVYSAGVVLWEALVGERLFGGTDQGVVLSNVLLSPIRPPSSQVAGIPPELDAVVMRALSRERTRRFLTAEEMATALAKSVAAAPRAEVGEWVRAYAAPTLDERARRIAAIANLDGPALHEPAPASNAPVTRTHLGSRPRSAWWQPAALGALALAFVAVAAALAQQGPRLRSAAAEEPPAVSGARLSEPTTSQPTAALPSSSGLAGAGGTGTSVPASATTRSTRTPGSRNTACNPPYTHDADGHVVFKVKCL